MRAFQWVAILSLAGLSVSGLGGCASSGSGGMTESLGNMLRFGSATEPPIAAQTPIPAADCPSVLVIEGRSAIRSGSNQVSIANVARECIERPGGAIAVKVGVEGRALLGPGGGSARFDVPVSFVLRRGDQIIVSRVKRVSVSIPAGETQSSFVAVEGNLIVPPKTGDYDIEVGLGSAAPAAAAPRRRRG